MTKLFIGGLPGTCTTPAVQEYFGQFGTLTDAVSMDGRGFGFVTYEDFDVAMEVIGMPHSMDGRHLDVKQATVEGTKGAPAKGNKGGGKDFGGKAGGGGGGGGFVSWATGAPAGGGKAAGGNGKGAGPTTDKIFVGGLPPDCGEDKLVEHFEVYGTIVDSVVMKDRATGKPRGFGFVTFDNTDSAEAVMADIETHQIDGKWIEVKRADGNKPKGDGGGGGKGGFQAPAHGAFNPAFGGGGKGAFNPAFGGHPAFGGGGCYGAPPVFAGGYSPYGPPPAPAGYGYVLQPLMKGKGKGYSPY